VVEIDPRDPQAAPIKRTALGRMAHEGAACSVGPDGRLAFYMADDWEFEHVYKFVTARAWDPARREANRDLLDEGVLYAARFNPDGSGDWLPLVHGQGPLIDANGFADQGAVLVRTRQAADALGATSMDRPEWIVPHPVTREVYCACTGNTARGRDGNEGPNPANPRAPNPFGHLLRWRDDGGDPAATRFRWDVFVQAGPSSDKGATINGDRFACPDGLWIDSRGTLWVQTDVSPTNLGKGDFAPLGNNQMLAVDPAAGVFKRFLTGPRGCEITGFHTTPDNRTAFVNEPTGHLVGTFQLIPEGSNFRSTNTFNLVANAGYRRFLAAPAGNRFAIDPDKVAADAQFDGVFVLRTNMKLSALLVVLRYRNLLAVEQSFLAAKTLLATRPVFHRTDAAIRGHIGCTFLALLLRKELLDRLAAHRAPMPEWQHIIDDLLDLSVVEVEQDGRRAILRTTPRPSIDPICRAIGLTLPPIFQEMPTAQTTQDPI
jgi:hypothetical protein